MSAVHTTQLHSLRLLARGKVRDIYEIDDQRLLMVATDRLSAFDVVLAEPIPEKGQILTSVSNFWFELLADVVPNHLTHESPAQWLSPDELPQVEGRAVVVKRLKPLPVEAIVRGYLAGSGWKEYRAQQSVCGISLPAGLREAEQLPQPIFTPSTKAAVGDHDINIDFATTEQLIGTARAAEVRDTALHLYQRAAEYALARGIIIADTKFEFGLDEQGTLHVIDEVLTPDSSRFWPVDGYQPGTNPPSFDKQFVRDWLESTGWNKTPPAPTVPANVAEKTAEKYREAWLRLTKPQA